MANLTFEAVMAPTDFSLDEMVWSPWISPILLLLMSITVIRLVGSGKGLILPPRPKGALVFGMLFRMGPLAQKHKRLLQMSKEFGALFAVKAGLRYVVVVTSSHIAHEALIKDDGTFGTRPKLLSRLNFTGWRSVNSALTGPYWREVRKNLFSQVLSTSRVASFKPFREMELNVLVDRLSAQATLNDNVVAVLSNCRFTMFSILLHVIFSKKFEPVEIEEVDEIMRKIIRLLTPQLVDYLPFLQFSFLKKHRKHYNECQALLGRMRSIFTPLIEEHRKLRKSGTPAGDYVESLIVFPEEMNLVENDILGLIGEMLAGGTDTTANTLEWAMGNLTQYPEIQARLFDEIYSVCDEKPVTEEDITKMPYLHAVVKETLRKHPSLPLGLPRGLTKQGKLRGYDIPEDAMVLFHIQAIQNDSTRWDRPEQFNPDRFLCETPNTDHVLKDSNDNRLDYIPFGAGRRMCPGAQESGLDTNSSYSCMPCPEFPVEHCQR